MVARDAPGDYSFWGNDPEGYSSLETRRRIAAQMMANSGKKGYPKNIGEGLSSIGDSVAEVAMFKALQRQEAAAKAEREADAAKLVPEATPPAAVGPRADVAAPITTAALPPPDETAPPVTPPPVVPPPVPPSVVPPQASVFPDPEQALVQPPRDSLSSRERIAQGLTLGNTYGNNPWPRTAANAAPWLPQARSLQQEMLPTAGGGPATGVPAPQQVAANQGGVGTNPVQMTEADRAQAATLADVVRGGPADPYTYAPTASLRDNVDTLSDAPSVTGISPKTGEAVRNSITNTIMQPPVPEVPQPNPTQTGATPPTGSPPDQRLAQSPGTVSDIQPAPRVPVPPPVVQPPAGNAPPPAYEMAPPQPPPLPQRVPKTDRERQAEKLLLSREDPQTRQAAQFVLQQEKTKRDEAFAIEHEQYKARMQHYTAQQGVYETFKREREQKHLETLKSRNEIAKQAHELNQLPTTQAQEAYAKQQAAEKMAQEIVASRESAADKARFGRDPEKFFVNFEKDKASAQSSAATLESNRLALKAIRDGVITGSMADMRINAARFRAWAFDNGLKGDEASNTQVLKAMMTNALGSAVRTINGEGGVGVSNTDVKLAGMAAGADPNLELSAIDQLLRTSNRINARKLNDYEDKHDYYLRGHRAEKDFAIPTAPTADDPRYVKRLLEHKDSAEAKAEYDKRFGDGAADLEIARAKRRERRGE